MTRTVQDDLHDFAVALLERRGALVDWASAADEGLAVLTPELRALVHAREDTVRISSAPGGEGLCVNLASDFLDEALRVLEAEPRTAVLRSPDLYVKRGKVEESLRRTYSWLNAKVVYREARPARADYHTWWFHVCVSSEDRWETRLAVTVNAESGAPVVLPDPLERWELMPGKARAVAAGRTYARAVARAAAECRRLAAGFFDRTDARLERDRKRLRDYYGALAREADKRRARGHEEDAEQVEARKRAVQLELRRKLAELDERYAAQLTLAPLVLVSTKLPALAVDLAVFRKQARRVHTVFWNSLTKQFEPLGCSRCGSGTFAAAFTNDTVEPLCQACEASE